MSDYRVDLEVFAGPLDLLLYLVRKDEVEIYDIPIAHITEQYVKYIEMLKMFDIDLAGDFLVMAATLMEIKSAMLLPVADPESDEQGEVIDPRSELVRQLLEYKKFKDAANLLQDSAEIRKDRFTRPDSIIAGLKKSDEPELDLDQVSVWTLLEAFDSIMQATGRLASYDNIKDDTPIDLYQIEMLHRLQTEGPMTFQDIFKGKENRLVMVGLFLAMLELIRDQLIFVEQANQSAPIMVRALTDEPAEQAVMNTIAANLSEESRTDLEQQEFEIEEPQQEIITEESIPVADEPRIDKPKPAPIPIQELPPIAKPDRNYDKLHNSRSGDDDNSLNIAD
ncbi:MAG: segregation/condensation protein A [Sedimentisphaerales bacterium]|nr:segregation/condensation protein A [Sedimentisphaerales bacterium]